MWHTSVTKPEVKDIQNAIPIETNIKGAKKGRGIRTKSNSKRVTKLKMFSFFKTLVYNDKTGSMRKLFFYSVDEADLKHTLQTLK